MLYERNLMLRYAKSLVILTGILFTLYVHTNIKAQGSDTTALRGTIVAITSNSITVDTTTFIVTKTTTVVNENDKEMTIDSLKAGDKVEIDVKPAQYGSSDWEVVKIKRTDTSVGTNSQGRVDDTLENSFALKYVNSRSLIHKNYLKIKQGAVLNQVA